MIAAIATYLSPLHDVTGEILSRTRLNLYDLVIAFIAGIAGAIAICTRKNYITIIPGVAIATAVIPPLSVAGFGIGTWNFYIAGGGFFLFFTNFVAIIFATSIIFYLYGFKPGIVTERGIAQLRKRIIILTLSFIIISIPLIYTLHVSVAEVRLRGNIQFALKQEFDVERRSHLDTFGYIEGKEDALEVSAIVNTVDYLKEAELKRMEEKISRYLKRNIILNKELNRRYDELINLNRRLSEAQIQLAQSERLAAAGQVAAAIAHSIGTPLHSILGHLHRLKRDTSDNKREERLKIIHSLVERVVQIIQDLLDTVRKPAPSMVPVRINKLLE